jgi:hypothetical protein
MLLHRLLLPVQDSSSTALIIAIHGGCVDVPVCVRGIGSAVKPAIKVETVVSTVMISKQASCDGSQSIVDYHFRFVGIWKIQCSFYH